MEVACNLNWFVDPNSRPIKRLDNANVNSGQCDFHNEDDADINANEDNNVVECRKAHSSWKIDDLSNFPMLDIIQNSPEVSSHRIPMDFSPYLLSASPPSSGFELLSYATQPSHDHIGFNPPTFHSGNCPIHCSFSPIHSPAYNSNLNRRRNGPLKSIILKSEASSDSEGDSSSPESPHSPGRTPKKVSFADHKGLVLAHVRLVKESPDEPPQLNPEVLSSLTRGANADITCKPSIKLCFSQPASDYLAFREKIDKNLICLENVILRDYTVEGTIKVKNVAFEKHVFLRMSLDEWETFEDVDATYVPGPGLSFSDPYDTFSFKMEISPSFDVSKKVQFAVSFEENGSQHWDNNDGQNYCIVSEHFNPCRLSSPVGPCCNPRWLPEKRTDTWSEFSVWRDIEGNSPYY